MTTRRAALEAFKARLERIHTRHGFETDAGESVFLNEAPAFGDGDPDVAIAMLVGEDSVRYVGENVHVVVPIEVHALAKIDPSDYDRPWLAAEDVLGDIKKAVELTDRTLGGLLRTRMERGSTRTLAREEGTTAVGVSVTYLLPMSEAWGVP